MKRTIEQWINCTPETEPQSRLSDAREDIMELAHENRLMREVLCKIGYPRRGTEEEHANIQTAAMWVQEKWTVYDLNP